MGIVNLFPIRVPIGSVVDSTGTTRDVLMTPEFARALADVLQRIGGATGLGSDDIALLESFGTAALVPDDVSAQGEPDASAQIAAMRAEISDLRSEVGAMQAFAAIGQQLEELRALVGMVEDPAAMVRYLLVTMAPLLSAPLAGIPTAPTAAVDTSTTQLASTAFVVGQAAAVNPLIDGVAAAGTSKRYARADHIHPVDTSRQATIIKGTAVGSRGGNAALASLLSALAGSGLVTDSTTV